MAVMMELVIMFSCFAIVWWRWRIRTRACRRKRKLVVLRRRLQAFYDCEEDDLREIVSVIVANRKYDRNSCLKLPLNLTFAPNR